MTRAQPRFLSEPELGQHHSLPSSSFFRPELYSLTHDSSAIVLVPTQDADAGPSLLACSSFASIPSYIMASIPGYSAATGRTRSSDGSSAARPIPSEAAAQPAGISVAEPIEAPETVFFDRSSSNESQSDKEAARKSSAQTISTVAPPNPEPQKCWICYMDETEDTPLNSEWRSPCPCALTAHEACLLDWLADLENPRSRKSDGAKMVCPQCKSEIVVTRPRSYIVDVVRMVEKFAGRLVLPGMVFTLAGTVWAGCCAHGVYSMYFVFGTEEARHILEDSVDGSWHPGLNLGLPLIPLVLIFSRTRYSEGLLPAIPVLFFASHHPSQELELDFWPPSAAMTFAALPYVKSFYSAFYERFFGALERKWLAEVQPRAGEDTPEGTQQQAEAGGGDGANGGNGQILMEIDLEWQMGMGQREEDAFGGLLGGHQQDNDNEAQQGDNPGEGRNGQVIGFERRNNLIHETSNLADVVLGALVFPAISSSMGGLLKYVLPKSWTTPASALERGRPGLLQSRWGRSVVGGCMFVLLKDALVLYCRWKLAQTHRKRKVLNYDRTKKQAGKSG